MLALDAEEVEVKPFVMPQRAWDPLSDWEVRLVFVSKGTHESPDKQPKHKDEAFKLSQKMINL